MLDLLHDSCTIWDIFQPDLVKKSSMTDYVAADFDQSAARGQLTYEMTDYVIDIWGDVALARFYLTYDYQAPNPTAGKGRITRWRRTIKSVDDEEFVESIPFRETAWYVKNVLLFKEAYGKIYGESQQGRSGR